MTILVQISDTHLIASSEDHDVADINHPRAVFLRRCVEDINTLDPQPDAVIHTGDVTHHARREEYVLAREILAELNMPVYITPGNRDSRALLKDVFADEGYMSEHANFIHYAKTIGEVRLVAVDTLADNSNMGDLNDERLAALKATLDAAPHTPTALFMHHPPFEISTSKYPFQFVDQEPVEKLTELVRSHPQVIRVFCGHSHRFYESHVATAPASTLPSTALDLRLGDGYPATMSDTPVYLVHRFNKDTGFVSEARKA
ncbi:MAG: hypothetical protein COB59_07240 [Rhodospirillaceae bacterium]|nr:MAG: hypothetical protein COB59_07240 [Rhodospirillaceae bacterium]